MLERNSVEHCDCCEELTPHRHRTVSRAKLFSIALIATALVALAFGGNDVAVGGACLWVFVVLLVRERAALWSVHCNRCRNKIHVARNRLKPTLDGNTEILFFTT